MIRAALRVGLRYDEALRLPLGDVLDLINADAICNGRLRGKQQDDNGADFWALMERS